MTRPNLRPALLRRCALALGLASLALLPMSCATGGGGSGDSAPSMPAARASLRPEYRVFYDELQDYGDWVLIEPFGFVFRPKTRYATWSPYSDGFWSPSDSYGWIWVSGEPFGWATYHYGSWLEDPYQGWVWVPGLEWAPAWVSWTGNQSFVGWAALSPTGSPAGNFNVVARGDLGTTDLRARVLTKEKASAAIQDAEPIQNTGEVDDVTINRGPRIEWIEQAAGPLRRARVEDLGSRLGRRIGSVPRAGSDSPTSTTQAPQPAANDFKRAAESAASQARQNMQQKSAPERIERIRVGDAVQRIIPAQKRNGLRPAERDTSR